MAFPKDVRENVIRRIYSGMLAISWDELTSRERTKQYDGWVEEPDIGGVIKRFNDDPRHWIKDGPVKEWSRAKIGHRPYGHLLGSHDHNLVEERAALARKIVQGVLPGWIADPDSITEKPMRLTASPPFDRDGVTPRVIAWAPEAGFKNLIWAAMVAADEGDPREWILAVAGTFEKPVSADQQTFCKRIGERCGLAVAHIEL